MEGEKDRDGRKETPFHSLTHPLTRISASTAMAWAPSLSLPFLSIRFFLLTWLYVQVVPSGLAGLAVSCIWALKLTPRGCYIWERVLDRFQISGRNFAIEASTSLNFGGPPASKVSV